MILALIIMLLSITRSTETEHTSAKARLTPDPWSGSPLKFNFSFIGPLPTFPENFIQIRSEVFLHKVANRQTNRQTNIDDYISSEVIIITIIIVIPAQAYDGRHGGSDVVAGGALIVALVERRRSHDTQSAVCDEHKPVWRGHHVQTMSVLQPLIPVHNDSLYLDTPALMTCYSQAATYECRCTGDTSVKRNLKVKSLSNNSCSLCDSSTMQSTTGWRRINRTIQPLNWVYENLHKITALTLTAHRQIKRDKGNVHLNILR